MAVTKPARNFGGRPVRRKAEHGKRAHIGAGVALGLKQRLERDAAKRGWSISNEIGHRLELTYDLNTPKLFGLLVPPELQGKPITKENMEAWNRWLAAARGEEKK